MNFQLARLAVLIFSKAGDYHATHKTALLFALSHCSFRWSKSPFSLLRFVDKMLFGEAGAHGGDSAERLGVR